MEKSQREIWNGWETLKVKFNILIHHENANSNEFKILSYTCQDVIQLIAHAGDYVEQGKYFSLAGVSTDVYNC